MGQIWIDSNKGWIRGDQIVGVYVTHPHPVDQEQPNWRYKVKLRLIHDPAPNNRPTHDEFDNAEEADEVARQIVIDLGGRFE